MLARTDNSSQYVLTVPLSCQRGQKLHLNVCWLNRFHSSEEIKWISKCVDQTHPITARTQNVSQFVMTKTLPWQWGHKMHLNLYWPNPSYAIKDTKCNYTSVYLTPPMPARTQSILNVCCPNTSHASKDTKCNYTSVYLTPPMPVRTQSILNMCLPNSKKASEDTECISTCWPNPPILARAENSSKHVLQNPSHISEEAKFISYMCWPYHSHARENKNASQIVLTKLVPCQWEDKMYLKMFWPIPSNNSEDTKCMSTSVDQTNINPGSTQIVSQHILTKFLSCQRGNKLYLNMW